MALSSLLYRLLDRGIVPERARLSPSLAALLFLAGGSIATIIGSITALLTRAIATFGRPGLGAGGRAPAVASRALLIKSSGEVRYLSVAHFKREPL